MTHPHNVLLTFSESKPVFGVPLAMAVARSKSHDSPS